MRRFGLTGVILAGGLVFQCLNASAQTSLDALQQDLDQIKQQHQEASSQVVAGLLGALETASASPAAAVDLYQKAGGLMPAPSPVQTRYAHETPDEKAARLAQDTANVNNLAYVAQLHCGMMRYAALFVVKPDTKGLQDDWIAWLKSAAQTYPQLSRDSDLMTTSMKESIISFYFGFHGWGDKEQGGWKVKDLPKMYRAQVLEPLRTAHNPGVLDAWDVFIAMRHADLGDSDQWVHVVGPNLAFEKGCDDIALGSTVDKLAALIEILKANPDHPQIEDMTSRVHQMLQDLRAKQGGGTTATPVQPTADAPVPDKT